MMIGLTLACLAYSVMSKLGGRVLMRLLEYDQDDIEGHVFIWDEEDGRKER